MGGEVNRGGNVNEKEIVFVVNRGRNSAVNRVRDSAVNRGRNSAVNREI